MTSTTGEVPTCDVDLFADEVLADPYPSYRQLRCLAELDLGVVGTSAPHLRLAQFSILVKEVVLTDEMSLAAVVSAAHRSPRGHVTEFCTDQSSISYREEDRHAEAERGGMGRWLVTFDLQGGDSERLEVLTQDLLTDLRELGVVRVDRVRGNGPEGSKAGAALEIGRLVLSGTFSAAAATAFARVMIARFDQAKGRRVSIEKDGEKYEIDALSVDDQHALVEAIEARLLEGSSAESDSATTQQ